MQESAHQNRISRDRFEISWRHILKRISSVRYSPELNFRAEKSWINFFARSKQEIPLSLIPFPECPVMQKRALLCIRSCLNEVSTFFLKEPHINTDTYKKALQGGIPTIGTNVDFILEGINKYLLALAKEQIRLAFEQAEKEVSDLHQRTAEGIETARLAGKQIGQKPGAKLTTKKSLAAKEIIQKHNKSFGGSLNDEETIRQAGISRKTFYKYKKELLAYTVA